MPEPESAFTLWQLPNQTPTQMMAYVLRSHRGKLIVLDGGMPGDAPYLRRFLEARGGQVAAWFITHPHIDHFGAIAEILHQPGRLRIQRFYASWPAPEWMKTHGSADEYARYTEFSRVLARTGVRLAEVRSGDSLDFDEIHIEILAGHNPELTVNAINNSSLVLRVEDSEKSVLFTADLGEEAGAKLLDSPFAPRLRTDYIQMAHHGQNGVSEEFYRYAGAPHCLWPTPKWLWENDSGGGPGSGPWRTLEVRAWMDNLGVRRHYRMFDGLQEIR